MQGTSIVGHILRSLYIWQAMKKFQFPHEKKILKYSFERISEVTEIYILGIALAQNVIAPRFVMFERSKE